MRRLALLLATVMTLEMAFPTECYAAQNIPVDECVISSEEQTEETVSELKETLDEIIEADDEKLSEETESDDLDSKEDITESEEISLSDEEEQPSEDEDNLLFEDEEEQLSAEEKTEELTDEEVEALSANGLSIADAIDKGADSAKSGFITKAYETIGKGYQLCTVVGVPYTTLSSEYGTGLSVAQVIFTINGKEYTATADSLQSNKFYNNQIYYSSTNNKEGRYFAFSTYINSAELAEGNHDVSVNAYLKYEESGNTTYYLVKSPQTVSVNFIKDTMDTEAELSSYYGPYYLEIPNTTFEIDLSESSLYFPVIGKENDKITISKIEIYNSSNSKVWSGNYNAQRSVIVGNYQKYSGEKTTTDWAYNAIGTVNEFSIYNFAIQEPTINIQDYNKKDLKINVTGGLDAGLYSTKLYTSDGRSYLVKNNINVTSDTYVSSIEFAPQQGVGAPSQRGEYVTLQVYGFNLKAGMLPVFYHNGSVVSDSDTNYGYEPFYMQYHDTYAPEGAFIKIKKTNASWFQNLNKLQVSSDNFKILDYTGKVVDSKDVTVYCAEITQTELTKSDQYLRIYFDENVITEGTRVTVKIDPYASVSASETTTTKYDSHGRVFVEFNSSSNLYKKAASINCESFIVTTSGRASMYGCTDYYLKDNVSNINVPSGHKWYIYPLNNIGVPICEGTNTGSAVLSATQVNELKTYGTVRVLITDTNGKPTDEYAAHFKMAGTSSENATATYNLHFDNNQSAITSQASGVTVTGSMTDMALKVGESKTITANAFKAPGFTFKGWNTKADGSGTTYSDKASVRDLSTKAGETVTLYAMWEINNYTITYHLAGGTNAETNVTEYNVAQATAITFADATTVLPGYTFGGWYLTADYNQAKDKTKATKIEQLSLEDITTEKYKNMDLYAQWLPGVYTIHFDKNSSSATGVMKDITVAFGQEFALPANTFKNVGYGFDGWAVEADKTLVKYSDKENPYYDIIRPDSGKTEVTLYAVWDTEFTVAFHCYGGSINIAEVRENWDYQGATTEGDDNIYKCDYKLGTTQALPVPAWDGYFFGGWFGDASYKSKVTKLNKSQGRVDLYAKWTPDTYTIKFDGNGKTSGSMKTVKYKYNINDDTYIPDNTYKKNGYKFMGWSWEKYPAGTGEAVFPANYSFTAHEVWMNSNPALRGNNKTFTLYAVWAPDTYYVSFDLGFGDADWSYLPAEFYVNYYVSFDNKIPYAYGAIPSWALPDMTGFQIGDLVFDGWYTDAGFKKKFKGFTETTFGDFTLYAKWKGNIQVVYADVYGISSKGLQKVQYGKNITLQKQSATSVTGPLGGWKVDEAKKIALYTPNAKVNTAQLVKDAGQRGTLFDMNGTTYHTVVLYPYLGTESGYGTNTFNITFETNGAEMFSTAAGTTTPAEQKTTDSGKIGYDKYTYGQSAPYDLSKVKCIKTGYSFAGWYLDSKCKKKAVITDKTVGDITVYAKWTPITYTVKYYKSSSDNKPSTQKFTYGKSAKLKKFSAAKGYEVKGYARYVSGSVVIYNNALQSSVESEFDSIFSTYARNTTAQSTPVIDLYINQSLIRYYITYKFNINKGTFTGYEKCTYTYTINDTVTFPELERMGYTFAGWYSDAKLRKKVTIFKPGTTGNKTIYVKWKLNQ